MFCFKYHLLCPLVTRKPCSDQELKRKIHPDEALSTHLLPTTRVQRDLCGGVTLDLDNLPQTAGTKMAGNAMNLPCMGAMVMAAMLALSPKKWGGDLFKGWIKYQVSQ